MSILFTADTHFNHSNIIKYCGRAFPDGRLFPDGPTMNGVLIENWNAKVKPEDTVFHLGDFGFGNFDEISRLCQLLNGKKVLIKGNHDRHSNSFYTKAGFQAARSSILITINENKVLLKHRPPNDSDVSRWGFNFCLCGHVHEAWSRSFLGDNKLILINVGADVRGFAPMTLEEVKNELVEDL